MAFKFIARMIFNLLKILGKIQTHKHTYLTPSMPFKSSFSRSVLMVFGTASKMIPIESFIMLQVVIITIIENTNVHSGSAIFAFG